MNIVQYPHFLYVKDLETTATQDADGNWISSAPTWIFHSICREETNGSGRQVNGPDGKAVVYSSMVYAPNSASKVPENAEIMVVETKSTAGIIRVKGVCMKCDVSQLHVRLWV